MRKDKTDPVIYKILTPDEWAAFAAAGETLGSPLDRADGFIHFSTQAQLQGTLDKHFKDKGPLVLAEIPLDQLAEADLRWEPARNGALFPHLYAALFFEAVARHWPLHTDDQGGYGLPDLSRPE